MTLEQILYIVYTVVTYALCASGSYLLFSGFRITSRCRIILGGILFSISLILLVMLYPDIGQGLSAFSTVALAIFAAITIYLGWQQRQDSIRRDECERKERLINEIIDWSQDIQKIMTDDTPEVYSMRGKTLVALLLNRLKNLKIRSIEIEKIANTFDQDLSIMVTNTVSKIDKCTIACTNLLQTEEGRQLKEASDNFVKLAVEAAKSTNEIIETASSIKISLYG